MSSYIAKYVLCPYYRKEDGVKICCEGIDDDGTIHVVFASLQKRKDYQTEKCCKNFSRCIVAAMLDRKWEERLK